jgi:hypothetical protein
MILINSNGIQQTYEKYNIHETYKDKSELARFDK